MSGNKKRIWLAAACFLVSAVTAGFIIYTSFFSDSSGTGGNFLPLPAYFTIQSNIFVVFWTAYTGLKEIRTGLFELSPVFGFMISCYITVTGVVYWLVLVPMLGFVPILFSASNVWLHTVTPVFVPAVFTVAVKGKDIKIKGLLMMLIYPALYVGFAYILYGMTGMYVYPFLDPGTMGNGFITASVIALIAAMFTGIGTGYRYAWNRRNRKEAEIQQQSISV